MKDLELMVDQVLTHSLTVSTERMLYFLDSRT
jgi:hypothetical protein